MQDGYVALAHAAAPYWAAEGELLERYFAAPQRTATTDLGWLRAQCGKELVDGVEVRMAALAALTAELGGVAGRRAAVGEARELLEEHQHLDAFARAYDAIAGPDDPPLTEASMRAAARWPENLALAQQRARDRVRSPQLGAMAQAFTEGGCATLYAAGAARRGGSPADDAIAEACAAVYEDEVRHMRTGSGGLADADLSVGAWAELTDLVVGQLRLRLPMRNAQFAGLVAPRQLADLMAHGSTPRPEDLARAGVS